MADRWVKGVCTVSRGPLRVPLSGPGVPLFTHHITSWDQPSPIEGGGYKSSVRCPTPSLGVTRVPPPARPPEGVRPWGGYSPHCRRATEDKVRGGVTRVGGRSV